MYEINIKIDIPGIPEAIIALADALKTGRVVTALAEASSESEERLEKSAKSENKAPVESVNTPPFDVETKKYSVEDIGRAGAALIDQGKKDQLVALLGKYGVQSVMQLKSEQYPLIADDLRAMGATI